MTAPSSGPPGGSSRRLAATKPVVLVTGAIVLAIVVAVGVVLATGGIGGNNGTLDSGHSNANAQTNLLLDVTMVPPNGATDQSPATVVVVQATGAQLERVEVRALAFSSKLPGRFEDARHEWRSLTALEAGTGYAVSYTVRSSNGVLATGAGTFTTAPPGAA